MAANPPTIDQAPALVPVFADPGSGEPGSLPLTSRKRERFAQLVAQGFSQSDAYRQAFDVERAQQTTIWAEGSRLAADPLVSARIDFLRADASAHDAAAFALTRTRVLAEMARIALADPRRTLDEDGKPLPLHLLPDDVAAAVEQVDVLTGPDGQPTAWRYRLAKKSAALDQLAKVLGMFEQDNRQRSEGLAEAIARLAEGGDATAPRIAPRIAPPSDNPDGQP